MRRGLTITFLLSLASLAVTAPALAQSKGQPVPVAKQASPANGFEAEVLAAKTAMMGDPEAALAHARAATSLSRRNPDAKARLIGEATGHWLEGEALIRVNRP